MNEEVQEYAVKLTRVGRARSCYLPVNNPEPAARILRRFIGHADREVFVVMALNTRNHPIGIHMASMGSATASIVHAREIFKFAFLRNAASIIIAHNHLTGDVRPSPDDISTTAQLRILGDLHSMPVQDHLIITEVDFLSLRSTTAWTELRSIESLLQDAQQPETPESNSTSQAIQG